MKPFSFADILFLFLTLLITFTILWFVNKAKGKGTTEDIQSESEFNSDMDKK
jgi:H+/Cl- antiporter ClcA